MVYFDNAATTFPKPAAVKNAVDLAILRYGANPGRSGHDLSTETARQVYCVREKVAAFFGAEDAGQVVFTQNCTYALNTAIKGLVRPGDHVIISDLEHNSVLRPVHALSMRGELDYTIAETFEEDDQTVESFRNAIPRRLSALMHPTSLESNCRSSVLRSLHTPMGCILCWTLPRPQESSRSTCLPCRLIFSVRRGIRGYMGRRGQAFLSPGLGSG